MKEKRMNKSELPLIVKHNGIKIIGDRRFAALNEHLKSAYVVNEEPIPQNEPDFEQEINLIFDTHSIKRNSRSVEWLRREIQCGGRQGSYRFA